MKDGAGPSKARLGLFGLAALVVLSAGAAVALVVQPWANDSAPASKSTPTVDVERAVAGFDPGMNPREAVGRINAAAQQDRGELRRVGLDQVRATDPNVRWAALYALALVAEAGDAEVIGALTTFLDSSDLDERLAAATGLAGAGQKAAVPVLIAALSSSKTTSYVVMPSWRVARGALLTYVGEDLGLRRAADGGEAAAAAPAWAQWWKQHEASLAWNPATGTYR